MDYTREMVMNKVRQMFPRENLANIMEILDLYGTEAWEREKERVQLGILKGSKGDLNKLLAGVDTAKKDYRDILASAEYPSEMSVSATEMLSMSPKDAKVIRDRDRKQFLEWLQSGD